MKQIIVTGASRGIGKALVKCLSKEHRVIAISRTITAESNDNANIMYLNADITAADGLKEIKQVLEQVGHIDALVHNAGLLINKPLLALTEADFMQVYQVNVFAVARLNQLAIPFMKKGSHVVTISSMGGIQGSAKYPGLAAYSSSKGAVITLSELLAEEFKEHGIAFNVLALGAVQTEMLAEAFPGYKAPVTAEEMADYIAEFTLKGHQYFNGKVLQVSSSTP